MLYFIFMTLFLWTQYYTTHYDWKILIWNFHFTAHESGMQKVETLVPTCNGLASVQGVVTILVSLWDGNHARPMLKGRSVGSWCDFIFRSNMSCQTKLLNAAIVCSHGGSHTQCKRVTHLNRINLYFEGLDVHFRHGDMDNPQNAFS